MARPRKTTREYNVLVRVLKRNRALKKAAPLTLPKRVVAVAEAPVPAPVAAVEEVAVATSEETPAAE
ncbi:MAG: hypothetical protein NTX03_12120 [Bacteroidetes bacterium]|nr:hypothetical protein [Bacteroidota bacterium]